MRDLGNFDRAIRLLGLGAETTRARAAVCDSRAVDFDDRAPIWPPVDEPRLPAPDDEARVSEDLDEQRDESRTRDVQGAR